MKESKFDDTDVSIERQFLVRNVRGAHEESLSMGAAFSNLKRGFTGKGLQGDLRHEPNEAEQREKWKAVLKEGGALTKNDYLKHLVRLGIPAEFRGEVWRKLCNLIVGDLRATVGSDYYPRLLSEHVQTESIFITQIHLDLLRTLPKNKFYRDIDSALVQSLKRVLVAYSYHNPEIGYCQGINMIAAILLLHMKEEEAFWCLVTILDYIMPKEYYTDKLVTSQADQRVVEELVRKRLPQLSKHLESHEISFTSFCLNWNMTVFVDSSLPFNVLVRLWDTFMYDGNKVLFRFSLAILKIHERGLLKVTDTGRLLNCLNQLGAATVDPNLFMFTSYTLLNPFPGKQILPVPPDSFQ